MPLAGQQTVSNEYYRWEAHDFMPGLDRLHQLLPQRYPFFLQSVHLPGENSRFDILFAFPGQRLELRSDFKVYLDGKTRTQSDFLTELDQLWHAARAVGGTPPLPFVGGWFVFLGYELVQQIEPRLIQDNTWRQSMPVAGAVRTPAAIINDYQTLQTYLFCETQYQDHVVQLRQDLRHLGPIATPESPGLRALTIEEEEADWFLHGVDRIKGYIRAGDVFQVNLSRLWRATLHTRTQPVDIYRRLCETNPAPFAALVRWNQTGAILSSSPERLVKTHGRRIKTRPIAGTYPRKKRHSEDVNQARKLLQHPKERAEHIMLIDLERNDLGRICEPGSIEVSEFMTVESYRHVHHLVSEVSGFLSEQVTPGQVIRAVFPGGTITGCPKVRCMEIIHELEDETRGAYTGSVGYLNRNGDMDLNILIRTMTWCPGAVELRAGAGIVADSRPARELTETRSKAEGMLRALN